MYHSSQDVRASTMAISQSIKFRKNCLLEGSPSKFYHQKPSFMEKQNIRSLFQKDSKSVNGSIDAKRQNRRKAGSIVKIVKNFKSNEKDDQAVSRKQLGDGNNYLNSKLQYDRNNEESIGAYKKLYEQNKVLNEALKSKIYQSNEKAHITNPLIGLSNFSYNQENQFSRKTYTPNQDAFNLSSNSQQHVFNSKYQKMLEDYDKKKNFLKEEMQAMKQKSSLKNFNTFDQNLAKQAIFHHPIENSYKNQSLQRSKDPALDQKLKIIRGDSCFKGSFSDKNHNFKTHSIGLRPKQTIQTQKEEEIDKKFRAYQSKLQKHKDFQKRNPSVGRKDLNQPSVDKSVVKNLASSTKTQLFGTKNQGNEILKVFIDLIAKQIQKDQEVRVLKHSLKHVPLTEVESILKQKFEISAYPQNFKLSTEEYDPFFLFQKSQIAVEQTIRKLIGAIQIADNFWKSLTRGKLFKNDLEQVFDVLNYGKRDQIGINELARELSFHLGKTVRNKQIYLIYQRLTPLTKYNFVSKLEKENK